MASPLVMLSHPRPSHFIKTWPSPLTRSQSRATSQLFTPVVLSISSIVCWHSILYFRPAWLSWFMLNGLTVDQISIFNSSFCAVALSSACLPVIHCLLNMLIGFIGSGKIAQALIKGFLTAGILWNGNLWKALLLTKLIHFARNHKSGEYLSQCT